MDLRIWPHGPRTGLLGAESVPMQGLGAWRPFPLVRKYKGWLAPVKRINECMLMRLGSKAEARILTGPPAKWNRLLWFHGATRALGHIEP